MDRPADDKLIALVDDMVWDHFLDEIAALTTNDEHDFLTCAKKLWDIYGGDRDEINDAVWRIGSELCDNPTLITELTEGDGNAVGWFYARIRHTAPTPCHH